MHLYSVETVCAFTGTLPATLQKWQRAGLISQPAQHGRYTHTQLSLIQRVLALTATGSTLPEIYLFLQSGLPLPASSWDCRQSEMRHQLHNASDSLLQRRMRQMGSDYSGDDFVNACLRPLNQQLRSDNAPGSATRQTRFHDVVVFHARTCMRASVFRNAIPVFLEAVSVRDATEIWIEAIRLTGQGCRVEVSEHVTGVPARARHRHEHHLMWCGAGISRLMQWNYREQLRDDKSVLLSGPDAALFAAA